MTRTEKRLNRRVARWLGTLAMIAIVAGACRLMLRPPPLSPVEMQMLGTWRSVPTDPAAPGTLFLHEYRSDRTVVRRELNGAAPPARWSWRVEDGELVVEQQHSLFDRVVNDPPPDLGRLELISATPEELVFGPRDNPTVLVRDAD